MDNTQKNIIFVLKNWLKDPRIFFTSALSGNEWLTSRLGRFIPDFRWIGGWVGHKAGLESVKRNSVMLKIKPGPSSLQPIAIPTELSRFQVVPVLN
jgi:hypothetical protein